MGKGKRKSFIFSPAMHAGYVFVNLVPRASPFEIGKGKTFVRGKVVCL